jgi:hypothetical protein
MSRKGAKFKGVEIGSPTNAKQGTTIHFDSTTGKFEGNNVPPDWQRMLSRQGVRRQVHDPAAFDALNDATTSNNNQLAIPQSSLSASSTSPKVSPRASPRVSRRPAGLRPERAALLDSIETFQPSGLRSTVTNDRSAPNVGAKLGGSSSPGLSRRLRRHRRRRLARVEKCWRR